MKARAQTSAPEPTQEVRVRGERIAPYEVLLLLGLGLLLMDWMMASIPTAYSQLARRIALGLLPLGLFSLLYGRVSGRFRQWYLRRKFLSIEAEADRAQPTIWNEFAGVRNTPEIVERKVRKLVPILVHTAYNETLTLVKRFPHRPDADRVEEIFQEVLFLALYDLHLVSMRRLGPQRAREFYVKLLMEVGEALATGSTNDRSREAILRDFAVACTVRIRDYREYGDRIASPDLREWRNTLLWQISERVFVKLPVRASRESLYLDLYRMLLSVNGRADLQNMFPAIFEI